MGDNSPQRTDWGLHQYHIRNTLKDEGELVVLKIFHKSQNHRCEYTEKSPTESEWDISTRDDSKEEQMQEEMYVDQNTVSSSKDIVCTTGFSPIIQANDYAETDYLDHISLQERYRILLADKSNVKRNHEGTTDKEDICCMLQEISSAPPIVECMVGEEISDTQMSDMECFVGSNQYERTCSSRDISELPITSLTCGSENNQLVDVKLESALEGYEIESSESPQAKSHHCSENVVLVAGCLPKDSQTERSHLQGDLVENASEICKSASAEVCSQAKNSHAEGSAPSLGVKSELIESVLPDLCENSYTRLLDHDGGIAFRSHQRRKRKTASYSTDKTLEDAYTNVEGIAYCSRKRRRRKTATDSIEKALDEDAPGLLQILLNRGIMVEEIKLYGAEEDGEMVPDCAESNFEDLENVIANLFPKRTSLLKVSAARHEKGERAIYCLSCLISLIEQSRYLQFRSCPVEWGWCRDLQSFIFVFRSHNRIVLERPEYGYATYFFEVVQSLPIEWQIRRLVIAMKLNGCGRTALIENRQLLVGEDLTEGEARVLEEYGWIRNTGLGTMLNYRDRVVHDRWTEKCVADWRAKIGKLLMTGYSEGQTITTHVPKKIGDLLENLEDIEIDIKLEDPF